jgi:putative transcriptional regulator
MKVKEMTPGTDTNLGDELVASLTEGMAILRGDVAPARFHPAPAAVDVRAVRKRLGLSQAGFARRFGFGLATVRDWEQGRYQPDQAARSYLRVIEREPEVVERALQGAAA